MHNLAEVKNLGDWPRERQQIEKSVLAVLGKMSKPVIDAQLKTMDETEFPGYVRRRVNYFVDEWNRVSAWLMVPHGGEDVPAIICLHRQVAQGKDEPAGISGDAALAFAKHYAEQGYVTLAPDAITAGERISAGREAYDTGLFYKDNPHASALGKMLEDHRKCIDLLGDVREVDAERIGVIGHGLGGQNAMLLAAFDDRVRACVASCAFTCFHADPNPERWARDSGFVLLPKLRAALKKKTFPFEWDDILAMAAPNATLVVTAMNDDQLPNTKSCVDAVAEARKVYSLLGAEEALQQLTHKKGHTMPRAALDAADDWFERWL